LAKTVKELRRAMAKAAAVGIDARVLLQTLASEVDVELDGGSPSAQASGPEDDQRRVLGALRELAAEKPPGSLLSVRELRRRVLLDKDRFDRAALALAASRQAVLHYHDFPASLSEEEREGLVRDARGTHYVGIVPRSSS
jgi:hypothetical protein